MNYKFNYSDSNYSTAINYDGTNYYNCPLTIDIDGKLFVLPFGTSDTINTKLDTPYFYIVGENSPLDYISMVVIDLSDNSVTKAYLDSTHIYDEESRTYEIFDKCLDEQIEILAEYLY